MTNTVRSSSNQPAITLSISIIFSALLLASCSSCSSNQGQDTGKSPGYVVDSLSPRPTPGYVLFEASGDSTTYLVDKRGCVVNRWKSHYDPGMSVYLLENGDLLKSESLVQYCGYPGGRIARYDWDNNLIWAARISSDTLQQCHDIYPLPNKNVLAAVWELITWDRVKAAGRTICMPDPGDTSKGIWSGMIIELQPVEDTAKIVWQWRFWDHLVSDSDSVAANPQLMNVNFLGSPMGGNAIKTDWIHMNAITYNSSLDQIMISSRNLNEIYILDHTTTTAEAASHKGGKYGKGGDFLYRWGNAAAYNMGDQSPQYFFGQHSPYWLDTTNVNASQILVNNDGYNGDFDPSNCLYRTGPQYDRTTFDLVDMPYDNNALSYGMKPMTACAPSKPNWTGMSPEPAKTYTNTFRGSAQLLPNNNILVDAAAEGIFYELDTTTSQIVWQYQLDPVDGGAFRCHQYDTGFVQNILKAHNLKADCAKQRDR